MNAFSMALNLRFNNFTFQGKKFTKFANVNIFEFQKKVDQPKKYDKIKLILLSITEKSSKFATKEWQIFQIFNIQKQ